MYQLLKTDDGVKAAVVERIYPVTMPQFAKGATFYPAVVFSLASRERRQTHDGPDGLVRSHFNVDCFGRDYFDVKKLADSVRLAANGQSEKLASILGRHVKGVFLENETDDYVYDEVEELSLFVITQDFTVQHREGLHG